MKTITFITTNKGKVTTLQKLLPEGYEIKNIAMELPEIQARSASEISLLKAKAAYEKLHCPLIVQDSSCHITALKGFPGVYIKYVLETLGLEGILKLLHDVTDRSYYFEGALTYIESPEHIQTFTSQSRLGYIRTTVDNIQSDRIWSALWRIVVPYGETETLAALSEKKIKTRIDKRSEFRMFLEWLTTREVSSVM